MERCWISCTIATEILINLRPFSVYSARKWQTLSDNGATCFDEKAKALLFMEPIAAAAEYERAEKMKKVETEGPWGTRQSEVYRTEQGIIETDAVIAAAQFARNAHAGQFRAGG